MIDDDGTLEVTGGICQDFFGFREVNQFVIYFYRRTCMCIPYGRMLEQQILIIMKRMSSSLYNKFICECM